MLKFVYEVWDSILCGLGSHAWSKWKDVSWGSGRYQLRECAHCHKKQTHPLF